MKKQLNDIDATYQYAITVLTPTFNRVHTLYRVYESLTAQTFKDFEWVIVDDGSVDETKQTIEKWKEKATFPINYYWQENQGKHIAINTGVKVANGELCALFDSDDACVHDALERIWFHWTTIPVEKRLSYAGIITLCKDQYNNLVGKELPFPVLDSNLLEINYKYNLPGEKWPIFRTATLKQFPFPETLKRTYFPEAIIWFQISRKYKIRFINELLRIYFIEDGSMVHGVQASKNAWGGHYEHLDKLNEQIDYIQYAFWDFMKSAIHYSRFSFHLHLNLSEQWQKLTHPFAKILWGGTVLVGFAVYIKDRLNETKPPI